MAVSLSDINATLEGMRAEQERTTEVTQSLVDKISAQMEATEKTNLRSLNNKNPRTGGILSAAVEGIGQATSSVSGLMGFLMGSFGKLIKWGAIAGVIAFFFGEQIMDLFEDFEGLTGINLPSLIAENPLISAAVGYGVLQLVKLLLKWSLKLIGGALAAAGAAAIAGILGSGADGITQVDPDERDKDKKKEPKKWSKEGKKGKRLPFTPPETSKPQQLPKETPKTQQLPNEAPKPQQLPKETPKTQQLPKETLPKEATKPQQPSKVTPEATKPQQPSKKTIPPKPNPGSIRTSVQPKAFSAACFSERKESASLTIPLF
jgi:hypothetical protein